MATPQINLRPWTFEELDTLVRFANNKKIADNLTDGFPHPYSRESGIAFLNLYKDFNPPRALAIVVDGIPCGTIGVHPQTDIHRMNAEMGYWLAEEYWGKGIMTKAVKMAVEYGFKMFDINRIFARPYGTNLTSQKVLEKAGFTFDARFEKTVIKNGIFLDELFYSIRRGA